MKALAFAIAFAALLFSPVGDITKGLLGLLLFLAAMFLSAMEGR